MNQTYLQQLFATAPPLFAPGEPLFWDDPHIAQQMLKLHLDPEAEAASRRHETIDRTVAWIVEFLGLKAGDRVLDLGCGPGLYVERLAERDLCVTGVDYSRSSIAYARQHAAERGLPIEYRYQNYLTLDEPPIYDAVLLIYGDLCPLAPAQRDGLLDRICAALKPGGTFIFDVTTRALRQKYGVKNHWYAAEAGFWKPGPHLVLEQGFDYPEHDTYLDQYIVIEPDDQITVYHNWFLDYSLETITPVIEARGFRLRAAWNDLTGTPYTPGGDWIGIAAQKDAAPQAATR